MDRVIEQVDRQNRSIEQIDRTDGIWISNQMYIHINRWIYKQINNYLNRIDGQKDRIEGQIDVDYKFPPKNVNMIPTYIFF